MKTNNKKNGGKSASVRVPSWDPAILNRDLLNGLADDPMIQGRNGWAYRLIKEFIGKSFPMGHNPLETLRKILPQWKWDISEVEWSTNEELESVAYCSFCSYCGSGVPKGTYGEEQVLCQWAYHHSSPTESRVYWITATRPTKDLGCTCKTAGKQPHWVLVDFNTAIGVKNGWNTQPYPTGHICEKSEPHTFRHFAGLIPDGTRPTPVEKLGESRDWQEGSPWGSSEWGKSGYEQDYLMPDGSKLTKSVTTDEWP